MKTIFKVGMTVYDQIVFPDVKGKVVDINEYSSLPVKVHREDGKGGDFSYTTDGRYHKDIEPTLSTKPYTLENFEQKKSSAPSYEEAIERAHDKGGYYYMSDNLAVPSKELADATMALLKLLFLRDYYNKGWQPNWKNDEWKYFIECYQGELNINRTFGNSRVLAFKSKEIRDKFLEEQKELLEIAKPLL
jgi:hypothetical protein